MSCDATDEDSDSHIIVAERGTLAVIRVNRPEQRNSLSIKTLEELERESYA